MVVEFICSTLLLQAAVSHSHNTVGIVGYRESVFGHKVILVHPGSPLEGIVQPGDNVIAVDGTQNYNTRGEPGSPVTLTVKRNDDVFEVTVKRVAVQELQDPHLTHYFNLKD